MEQKDWGMGIPEYTEDDLMTEEEILNFAMQVVAKQEIEEKGNELVAWLDELNAFPNIVAKINGELSFIVVKGAIATTIPTLSKFWRNTYCQKAQKEYGAKCYFASVSIGSYDAKRFEKRLGLRGDGFLIRYKGLEEVEMDESITQEEIEQGLEETRKMEQ